jgi:hypothetical protein
MDASQRSHTQIYLIDKCPLMNKMKHKIEETSGSKKKYARERELPPCSFLAMTKRIAR